MDVTIKLEGLREPASNKMAPETEDHPRSILLFRTRDMGDGHLYLWATRAEARALAYMLLTASDDGIADIVDVSTFSDDYHRRAATLVDAVAKSTIPSTGHAAPGHECPE